MIDEKKILATARNGSQDPGVMANQVFGPIIEELGRLGKLVAKMSSAIDINGKAVLVARDELKGDLAALEGRLAALEDRLKKPKRNTLKAAEG